MSTTEPMSTIETTAVGAPGQGPKTAITVPDGRMPWIP